MKRILDNSHLFFMVLCILIIFPIKAEGASILYKELNLMGGYSDTRGWIGEMMMLQNSIGAEYFRKFSNDQGDYLTLDLQPRLTYDFSEDFRDAWAIEIHNAWLEYKLGLGYKLRLGHFDPFFGLEPLLDTHGTLLQTLAHRNIGFKSDWGIGFRAFLKSYDYDAALQLGSGMSIRRENGNFLLTQRIGKPQGSDFIYGISLLYGKVLMDDEMNTPSSGMAMPDKATLKKRIGIDVQYPVRSFSLKGELAYGKNDDEDVLGLFAEVDYIFPFFQAIELEIQGQTWQEDISGSDSKDTMLSLGLSYKLTSRLTFRTAYFHNFDKDKQIFLQLYYFGT